jgi:putative ATPase
MEKLREAEEAFFTPADGEAGRWTWDAETLEKAFRENGFTTAVTALDQKEERLLTGRDISLWFDPSRSAWGAFIARALGEENFLMIRNALEERVRRGPVTWKWKSLLVRAGKE